MVNKSLTPMRNTKASSYGGSKHTQSSALQARDIASKLYDVSTRTDMDSYTKQVMAKKYLQGARGMLNDTIGKALGNVQEEYKKTSDGLFSSHRALGDADVQMLPVAYEKYKDGTLDLNNPNSAQMVIQLSAQGLIGADAIAKVDELHTPDTVASLDRLMNDTESLSTIKKEFENEVNAIFPELDTFKEV